MSGGDKQDGVALIHAGKEGGQVLFELCRQFQCGRGTVPEWAGESVLASLIEAHTALSEQNHGLEWS